MADDIFDDHDGIIHQDPDGEDQGKEGDAVQRIAVEIEQGQGKGQGDRNGDAHDPRFPEPEGQPDQDGDGDDGDHHVKEQFIRFFFGRLSVVAGNGHLDIARDHRPFEPG